MSRFCFCNCPAGFSAEPERHAPDCPGRSGAGKARTLAPTTTPAQKDEGPLVDFGIDGRSIKVSQEAYSIFIAREAAAKARNVELQQLLTAADERIDALTTPPDLTAELRWIFGLMCFQCIHYAQGLRRLGHSIPEKAEHEQAAVIHWMLCHYLKDPVNWRLNAAAEMKSVAPAA
jgi:hypothetical protein